MTYIPTKKPAHSTGFLACAITSREGAEEALQVCPVMRTLCQSAGRVAAEPWGVVKSQVPLCEQLWI